ncbi:MULTISPECIES: sce7726 family protein [Pantoea]|uniref:sce7726 family protein n=1 Tax=Pantoea TaxID=53335 RepID=UPI00093158A9|nr:MULTISPECIES: sce7726 family protein [Pantoea]MCH9270043.1 sce7726 family protein [Pantoea ananatis]MCS4494615.1 sce7726 family protein [Pantoea sp. B623]MDJ0034189.1 sce7726 family protein [Pantoea ananatis]MDJ0046156.1 sce7726 family protein [Pantoea ananatis]NEK81002.1 sce7726 family protein [Pantoea ananatis]
MNYQAISKIFSRNVVLEIAKKNRCELFRDIIMDNCPSYKTEGKSIYKIYDEMYGLLKKKYRNEYVYKNEIAKNIIRKTHKFKNVSYVNEFKVNGCIADVAIFNDTSTAYEVKTELDSFDRLDEQLSVYKDVFEFVYVVIPQSKINHALKVAHDNTGIITLNEKNILNYERSAISNKNFLSKEKMFNCLKPSEYIFLYEKVTRSKPFGRPADVKEMCRDVFVELSIDSAQMEMLNILKARGLERFEKDHFLFLPQSLLATLLNLRLNQKSLMTLRENMVETIC